MIVWVICVVLFKIHVAVSSFSKEVTIKNGPIFGTEEYTVEQKKPYYAYKGIPYAQPPIGELRFADPVPKYNNWTVPLNATVHGDKCIQYNQQFNIVGSENCLYVNVYTPATKKSDSLPVMVWVYGGYFLAGDGNYETYGPDYILEEDVVFVSFNYRLGVFGFLSTEDDAASGNWGLKDQILALRWVQENIKVFGGNPDSVTLFGQSAGSASVSYLSQTPLTKGLFHRAIFQSGTSLNLWALSPNARNTAFAVGNVFGVVTTNSSYLVSKLRTLDATVLYVAATGENVGQLILTNPRDGLVFAPSLEKKSDTAAVVGKSHDKLAYGDFNQIPYMIGFTSMEGIPFVKINALRLLLVTYDLDPKRLIPRDMNTDDLDKITQINISYQIKSHYMWIIPVLLSNKRLVQFVTDDQFVRPIHEAVRLMSKYSSVFFYRFAYMGSLGNRNRTDLSGVGHGEDVNYIFRTPDGGQNPSDQDKLTRKRMVKLWTNFAKYSNPTPFSENLLENTIWEPVRSNDVTCLDIDKNFDTLTNTSFDAYSLNFWGDLYKKYGKGPYDTY